MNNREAIRQKARLDSLFNKLSASDDIELQAHWARYLCVLVSGFLEVAIIAIYAEYCGQRAERNIANYVNHRLNGFTNPNMTKIIDLAGCFSSNWAHSLSEQTAGEIKNAVDSIYANRNRIAHGKDSGVSYIQLREWYQNAIRLIDLIEEQCQGS